PPAGSRPRWRSPQRPKAAAVQRRNKPRAAMRLPRVSVAATGPPPQPLDVAADNPDDGPDPAVGAYPAIAATIDPRVPNDQGPTRGRRGSHVEAVRAFHRVGRPDMAQDGTNLIGRARGDRIASVELRLVPVHLRQHQ